jgi:hypothetical protein
MTTEQRFARIEHVTAAIAEERRKDRDEYKALWRDTQRQINTIASGAAEQQRQVETLAVETRLRIDSLTDRIAQAAIESRAADKRIEGRIGSLVSAFGDSIRKRPTQ